MAKALTAISIEKQKADPAKRLEVPDGRLPGLYLVVQPSGRKSWAVRYRHQGQPRKFTLDGFPSLETARKLARQALDALAEGNDPAATKREAKRTRKLGVDERDQFGTVARQFIERYARPKNRSWEQTARRLGLRPATDDRGKLEAIKGGLAQRWGNRKLAEITRRDIVEVLDAIMDAGTPKAANRTLAAIRRFFNWCIERDLLAASPCAGVKPPAPELSRDRVLSDEEIRWLWRACAKHGYPFGSMVKLLLLTGQRRDEVARLREAETNRAGRTWTIPRTRAKNDREHVVPLSEAAMTVIDSLPRIKGKAGYLFTTSGEAAVSGYSRAKASIDAAMLDIARKEAAERGDDARKVAIPPWRFHDLRRTAASGMARLGIAVHVVEAAMNHKSGAIRGVAAVYNRYQYGAEKQAALEAWGRFVASLVNDAPAANVVPMRAAQ
jgi:integrase